MSEKGYGHEDIKNPFDQMVENITAMAELVKYSPDAEGYETVGVSLGLGKLAYNRLGDAVSVKIIEIPGHEKGEQLAEFDFHFVGRDDGIALDGSKEQTVNIPRRSEPRLFQGFARVTNPDGTLGIVHIQPGGELPDGAEMLKPTTLSTYEGSDWYTFVAGEDSNGKFVHQTTGEEMDDNTTQRLVDFTGALLRVVQEDHRQ